MASTQFAPSSSGHETVRRLAKRVAFAVDDIRPREVGATVLAYHRVGGWTSSPVDLSASMFRRQMAHLRAMSSVASLDDIVDSMLSPTINTEVSPAIGVTFDDGTADFVDVALPILVEYQIPATLYLATRFVDTRERYPANGEPITWPGLREALSTGLVTIGSHTHSHVLLDRCSLEEASRELESCNGRIEDELGVSPEHFAYPKAVAASASVDREVRRLYRSAAVAGTRPNRAGGDPHHLYRSPIQNADQWDGFTRKVGGGMRTEDDVRRLVNVVRYRGKTQ